MEISSLVSLESPSVVAAPKQPKFSDSLGMANSNASGKHVLVALLGSLLKLEINGSEEPGSKLKTSSLGKVIQMNQLDATIIY